MEDTVRFIPSTYPHFEKTVPFMAREKALEEAVRFHIGTAPQRPVDGTTVVATAERFETFLMRPEPAEGK